VPLQAEVPLHHILATKLVALLFDCAADDHLTRVETGCLAAAAATATTSAAIFFSLTVVESCDEVNQRMEVKT
jgi:hypothetical protein